MNKSNKKGGWTLLEMMFAMMALAILVGISVEIIKPAKVMTTPFAYAALQNLKNGNNYIMNTCIGPAEAVFPQYCNKPSADTAYLPTDVLVVETPPSSTPTQDYCKMLASAFTIVGNINCDANGSRLELTTGLKTDTTSVPNFRTANGVSYFYLDRPWVDVARGAATDDDPNRVIAAGSLPSTKIKEIMFDTNGPDIPNKIGQDQFPLRVYITGEVIPSTCETMGSESVTGAKDNLPASSRCTATSTDGKYSFANLKSPLSYTLYKTEINLGEVDADGNITRTAEPLIIGTSYLEASCKSGRDNLYTRVVCNAAGGAAYNVLPQCKLDPAVPEKNRLCVVRLVKPTFTGPFRLPLAL